jgi:tetratricopeptide (TPR) repeat protein
VFRRRVSAATAGDLIAAALQEAQAWRAQAERSGQVADLGRAAAAADRALSLCPAGAPERFAALISASEVRAIRFEATGDVADLTECVEMRAELVSLALAEQSDATGELLLAYARVSMALGLRTRTLRPVEEAVVAVKAMNEFASTTDAPELHAAAADILRKLVPHLPADHPDRAALAALRGVALVQWMDRTGDLSPLGEADEEADRAVRLCPPGDPNLLPFMTLRAEVRRLRYESEPTLETLDTYLDSTRQVLDRGRADHPATEAMLHNLGALHQARYRLTGEPADLDSAAHYLRLAADRARDPAVRASARSALTEVAALRGPPPTTSVPPGLTVIAGPGSTPLRPAAQAGDDTTELARHSTALTERMRAYERTGDLDLLERVCEDGRTLLAGLPAGHPLRWLIGMPLGPALMRRFDVRGWPEDLDEAVELLRVAAARPALNPGDLAGDLVNLAAALINRFLRDRSSADLDEAITVTRRAIEAVPPQDPARVRYLATLGTALLYRFEHTGRRLDLDDAIEIGKSALAAAGTGPTAAHAQANLGNRLRQRFFVGHDPADLDAAVAHLRAAEATGEPAARINLALALGDRGTGSGGRDDLLEALGLFRSVLADSTRPGSAGPARLGLAKVLGALGRTDEAAAELDGAAERMPGQHYERMDALVLLAGLRAQQATDGSGDWSRAAEAYAQAVAQLPAIVWRGLSAADRNQLITRWWGLGSDAAAAAVAAGAPEQAVEMLDHGRSVWWRQLLDSRDGHAALSEEHPDLVRRLTAAAAQLGDDGSADECLQRSREWDDAVAAVRARPGFERFLAATPFAELVDVAADGPVVLVNVSRHRCDALVLISGRVQVVPLPDLTAEQADERTRRYLGAAARTGIGGTSAGPREQGLLAYLEWLWEVLAAPVFDAVPIPDGSRLWWCASGPLALAPLHAAGYHDPDDTPAGRTVLDRVVSSTTPTLRALRHARRARLPADHRPLVVACDERPRYVTGLPDLPSAAREAQLLRSRFPAATVLTGPAATRARVTGLLGAHTCVHFACHGDSGASTGEAALFLADEPLTMTDVARLDLRDAHLAVLTACHTAMAGADRPDEAGHLAAALQVAGYRHIVSTLWAIGDHTAADVADQLYRHLTSRPGVLEPARAAAALHAVTLELRRENPYQPGRWAPFVHFGA